MKSRLLILALILWSMLIVCIAGWSSIDGDWPIMVGILTENGVEVLETGGMLLALVFTGLLVSVWWSLVKRVWRAVDEEN